MAEDKNKNVAAEMDWDSGISAEATNGEFNLPPVGEYGFTVVGFEKTISKAGKKMAAVTLQLDESAQYWKVYDYLVLTANMEWKLATFFESLGLKKKGEPLDRMPWDKVPGATGRVKIKYETFNEKQSCKVDRYVVTDGAQAPKAPEEPLPFEV